MFHGIPQNTQTHPCVPSGTNVDKQFPLGLIGAVCLKPFFCSIGTNFLEGKSLPGWWETHRSLLWVGRKNPTLGRKQHKCCGINPCEWRTFSEGVSDQRAAVLFSPTFSLRSLCFLSMQLPLGFLYLGIEGEALQEGWKWAWRAPISIAGVWVAPAVLWALLLCRAEDETSGLSLPKFQRFFHFANYSPLKSQPAQIPFWAFSFSRPQCM